MFETLIASRVTRVRPRTSVAGSAVVHAMLAASAVLATRQAAVALNQSAADPDLLWLPPPAPLPPAVPETEASDLSVSPRRWFETVPAIVEVPEGIPEPVLENRFSLPRFRGAGSEFPSALPGVRTVPGAYLDEQVDEPVHGIHQPKPRYPPALQQAGIEGFVEAQFVVDTTGHVEPNGWKTVSSSNPLFEAPAREALLHSLFKPALLKGRPVRQLVQQRFVFAITR